MQDRPYREARFRYYQADVVSLRLWKKKKKISKRASSNKGRCWTKEKRTVQGNQENKKYQRKRESEEKRADSQHLRKIQRHRMVCGRQKQEKECVDIARENRGRVIAGKDPIRSLWARCRMVGFGRFPRASACH